VICKEGVLRFSIKFPYIINAMGKSVPKG